MKRLCLAVACLALLLASARTASPQSLADVAKRAEEERAKAAADKKEPTKVITNGDLKKDPSAPEAAATGDATEKPKGADAKPGAKKGAAEKTEPKQTEAYWKRRATELHTRLASDEKAAAAGREQVDHLRHIIDALGCVACRERNQLESQIIRMEDEQVKLDAKVASARSAIEEFEDEGRRAGVLPGWLRP